MIVTEYNMSSIYTGVVISMFDKIQLARRGTTPYTVPIYFADKDRLHKHIYSQQVKQNNTTIYQMSVPAMALSLTGMERALERQTNRMLKKKVVEIDDQNVTVAWNDVAVDFTYQLVLLAKSITELQHINEFVVSSFKNGLYYTNVKTPLYDAISTPIYLNTTDIQIESNELEYGDDRLVESTMSLTVRGILHNNMTSNNTVITEARLRMFEDLEYQNLMAEYKVVAL